MIDDDLNKLSKMTPPTASAAARQKAIAAGAEAFSEQQKQKTSQGNTSLLRLIHEGLETLWRNIMINFRNHRLLAGTAMASVATLFVTVAVMQQQSSQDTFGASSQIEGLSRDKLVDETSVKAEDKAKVGDQRGQRLDQANPAPKEKFAAAATPAPAPALAIALEPAPGPEMRVEEIVVTASKRNESPKVAMKRGSEGTLGIVSQDGFVQAEYPKRIKNLSLPQERDSIVIVKQQQNRDKFDSEPLNPVKSVLEAPVSTLSVDVDTASYAVVRRSLMAGQLPHPDAVRVEEMINYFDYDYELPDDKAQPFKPTVNIYPTPWNSDTKLMHIAIKGHDIAPAVKPATNLVFLLDVSGSMNQANKLPLLKNAFRMLISSLGEGDTVSIVTYAGRAGTVLEPTSVAEKSKILAALDTLRAGGSTAGAQGIEQAYALAERSFKKDGVNRVILATDGDFNVGITDREQLKAYVERKRETGVFLSVLGFGSGNYNDALMQTLAQNGNGVAAYIDTLNEARKVLVEEASSTLYPIAKDVKIQVEFNPSMVAEYRLIGYETRMLQRADFNNDKVDAAEIGAGHSVTAIYEITPVGSKARLIDDLRYEKSKKPEGSDNGEYAFLKMRYKLPTEDTSKLLTLPITMDQESEAISEMSGDVQFSTAVAAFGQKLRNESYVGDYSYDDIIALSQTGRGDDVFGYRAEFLNLVRLAKSSPLTK